MSDILKMFTISLLTAYAVREFDAWSLRHAPRPVIDVRDDGAGARSVSVRRIGASQARQLANFLTDLGGRYARAGG